MGTPVGTWHWPRPVFAEGPCGPPRGRDLVGQLILAGERDCWATRTLCEGHGPHPSSLRPGLGPCLCPGVSLAH